MAQEILLSFNFWGLQIVTRLLNRSTPSPRRYLRTEDLTPDPHLLWLSLRISLRPPPPPLSRNLFLEAETRTHLLCSPPVRRSLVPGVTREEGSQVPAVTTEEGAQVPAVTREEESQVPADHEKGRAAGVRRYEEGRVPGFRRSEGGRTVGPASHEGRKVPRSPSGWGT